MEQPVIAGLHLATLTRRDPAIHHPPRSPRTNNRKSMETGILGKIPDKISGSHLLLALDAFLIFFYAVSELPSIFP